MLDFQRHRDARGALIPFHLNEMPFDVERVFVISDVPAGTTRGRHSHRVQRQLLTCVTGRVLVELRRSGAAAERVPLGSGQGMVVEPGVWTSETYETDDTVLLVMADGPYDPADLVTEPPDA